VGIGTATPASTLDVVGGNISIASGNVFYLSGSGGNAYLQESGGTLFLGAGGAGRVQIASTGNVNIDSGTLFVDAVNNRVGIGTATPGYTLDSVSGDGNLFRFDRSGVQIGAFVSATNPFFGTLSNSPLLFMTNSTERARITSTGNVGIGTTSPASALHLLGTLTVGNSTYSRPALTPTNWGYSASYRVLMVGSASTSYSTQNTGAVTVAFNYDPSGNANGSFNGDGREILFRNGTQFVTPNAANTSFNLANLVLLDGNVGIGTTSPTKRLHVSVADTTNAFPTSAAINVSNNDSAAFGRIMGVNFGVAAMSDSEIISGVYGLYTNYGTSVGGALLFATNNGSSSFAERMRVTSAGNVGIGTTSPSERLHVSGNILATQNVTAYSDARVKANIEVIGNALAKVRAIRGVTFTRTDTHDSAQRYAGVIAQEIEAVLPEVVGENGAGMKHVAYGNIVSLLIEAVKELADIVESRQ
jgi:hypothetical protein